MTNNKSTLKYVAEEYGLKEIDREARDTFQLSLVVKNAIGTIVPPETDESGFEVVPVDYNDERNEGKTYTLERIFPTSAEYLVEGRYNYIKLTFNKVDFEKGRTLAIFLDINYKDDIRYEKLNPKYEGYIHAAGMILLLALMAVVMFNDVYRIFAR